MLFENDTHTHTHTHTHIVTQQVKRDSQNEITLKGLIPVTTYYITAEPIKIYWDLLVMISVYELI